MIALFLAPTRSGSYRGKVNTTDAILYTSDLNSRLKNEKLEIGKPKGVFLLPRSMSSLRIKNQLRCVDP
jgi:hypothetical protein